MDSLKHVLFGHYEFRLTGEPVYLLSANPVNADALEGMAEAVTGLVLDAVNAGRQLREAEITHLNALAGTMHQCARDMRKWYAEKKEKREAGCGPDTPKEDGSQA